MCSPLPEKTKRLNGNRGECNMEKSRLQTWLGTAVSGIRFAPDRKKVEEELRAHLEDKVCELQQFYHLDQDAAEERALERMGSAEESLVPWRAQIDRVEVHTGESGSNFVRYQCFVHEVSREATELRLYCDDLGTELSIPIKLEGRSETWVKN